MRMVDGDALSKETGKLWSEMPDGEELSKELMKAINHAPTVDAAPVKHGRWINRGLEPIKCSACGITPDAMKPIVVQVGMPYCPYCGAKMDLEE